MQFSRFAWVAALAVAAISSGTEIHRATSPQISPDGTQVLFSWQNDIWIASSKGGMATRLTINAAADTMPRWFPDGRKIAFVSNRYGSNDVFTMNSDGTDLRRVSFESGTEYLYSIANDGQTLYGYSTGWGRANLFCVNAEGGDMVRLTTHPFEMQYFPAISPDGKEVAYCLGGSGGNWRNAHQQGTDTAEIWVGNVGTPVNNNRQLTKNDNNDIFPMWGADNLIYFVSNRSGAPQIWCMARDGKSPTQLTKFDDLGTIRWAAYSKSGKIAMEHEGGIWTYDIAAKSTSELSLQAPDDQVFNPSLDISMNTGADFVAGSPDGKRAVIGLRGDLFLIPGNGGTTRRLTTNPGRDLSAVWIDNKSIVYVSTENDFRVLKRMEVETGTTSKFVSADRTPAEDQMNPVLSPDGKWIAYHRGVNAIGFQSVGGDETNPNSVAGSFPDTYAGGPSFSWSPDSKSITFSDQTERGANIYVYEVASGKKVQVARVARGAGRPYFSANGRSVFFSSENYGGADIDVVDLVEPDLTFAEDDLDKIDAERPKPSSEVRIDLRGIEQRLRRITREDATPIGPSPDGRGVWAVSGGQLVQISLSGGPAVPVAGITGPASTVSTVGTKTYVIAAGKILQWSAGQAAPVNFNAQYTINRRQEEMALFHEVWWAMNRMYYDPGMHGVDWNRVRRKYEGMVPFCFDRQDFFSLMFEMMNELDSSHLSFTAPPADITLPSEQTAFIGVEWDWSQMSQGHYVVGSVLTGSPADSSQSQLMKGDEVVTVDGQALGGNQTYAELMRNKVGKKVVLGIKRAGASMTLTIKPLSPASSTALRYEQFILDRRAEALALSNGTITYFHIQGMNTPSTDRFMRDARIYAEGKKAAVVDVRWNGGGNTANRVLASLRLTPWLNRKFRWMPSVTMSEEQFRGEAMEMPTALMTNQYSASNAEIFSEGFRQMKIGPIVGEATGGNVLTVAGNFELWDGGGVQIPFIGIYTVSGTQLERDGRKVDVDVRFDPNAWNEGHDNQLVAAVRALMARH